MSRMENVIKSSAKFGGLERHKNTGTGEIFSAGLEPLVGVLGLT